MLESLERSSAVPAPAFLPRTDKREEAETVVAEPSVLRKPPREIEEEAATVTPLPLPRLTPVTESMPVEAAIVDAALETFFLPLAVEMLEEAEMAVADPAFPVRAETESPGVAVSLRVLTSF